MATIIHRTSNRRLPLAVVDQIAADWGDAILLIGRILIGGIFVQSGFEKLTNLGGFAASLAAHGVPFAAEFGPLGAAVEFMGGLAIVLGLATRYAALLMGAFVVVATLLSHRFWSVAADQHANQAVHFAKNVAILGGFLYVFVTGGGRYCLDRWWQA